MLYNREIRFRTKYPKTLFLFISCVNKSWKYEKCLHNHSLRFVTQFRCSLRFNCIITMVITNIITTKMQQLFIIFTSKNQSILRLYTRTKEGFWDIQSGPRSWSLKHFLPNFTVASPKPLNGLHWNLVYSFILRPRCSLRKGF